MSSKKAPQEQKSEAKQKGKPPVEKRRGSGAGYIDPDPNHPYSNTQMVNSWTK